MKYSITIAVLVLAVSSIVNAIPIIPGAQGFGMETRAAYGAQNDPVICVVNSIGDRRVAPDDSTRNLEGGGTIPVKEGSFRECIEYDPGAGTGKIIVFEVSGTIIDYQSVLRLRNPYSIVAGQTAPSPGVTLRGTYLSVYEGDILVQHMRFRVGDALAGPGGDYRDSLVVDGKEDGNSQNVIIDHCSVSWALDENAGVSNHNGFLIDDVTWRYNIISEGLVNPKCFESSDCTNPDRNNHADGTPDEPEHSCGFLISTGARKVALIGNVLAHNHHRNPLTSGEAYAMPFLVNNVFYDWSGVANNFFDETENQMYGVVASNKYIHGYDTGDGHYAIVFNGPSHVYQDGKNVCNYYENYPDWDNAPCIKTKLFNDAMLRLDEVLVSYDGMHPGLKILYDELNIVSTDDIDGNGESDVKDLVILNAGARPADRDGVDIRIIDDMATECDASICKQIDSQDQIDSPRGSGDFGYPELAENYRELVFPDNPHDDADGDGYTNLEEWLHAYSCQVEGAHSTNCNGGTVPACSDGSCNGQETCATCPADCGECQALGDVFSDVDAYLGDSSNWEPINPSRWRIMDDSGSLRYGIITSDYENLSGSRLGEMSLVRGREYRDFTFSASVRSTEDFGQTGSHDYGVVFGYQDPDNYYYMLFSARDYNNDLERVINGNRELISETTSLVIPDGGYHDIAVEKKGDIIRILFDGNLELEVSDSTFSTGSIGIGSYNDASLWDDIDVIGYHRADEDYNCDISMGELIGFVDLWLHDNTEYTMHELMQGITLWKNGSGCY